MIPLSIEKIKQVINGKSYHIDNENRVVEAISTDSRKIPNKSIFIALIGDNFDGHEFAEQAVKMAL